MPPLPEPPDGDASHVFRITATSIGDGKHRFPNLQVDLQSLNAPALLGKATIIELFGSWCPNCHDAAELLTQLQSEYDDQRLKIVGLAFELTGDKDRDRQQVQPNRHIESREPAWYFRSPEGPTDW